jgi:hypothetical protein
MRALIPRFVILAILTPAALSAATPEQEEFFEKKIRPVLVESCYECHSSKKQQAGLRVDHIDFLKKGSENGPVLKPGDLVGSRIWEVLQHDPLDTQMPPDSKLDAAVLADIKRWIEMGAPWPASDVPATTEGAAVDWTQHWAFQPIGRPQPPETRNTAWPRTQIDRFVLAKLEASGMRPSDETDRATLLRRLKYDLLGLPPSFEEIQAFLADESPDAYEKRVESYLNAPQFGERWGRHWLDVARYADTKGYVFTEDRNYYDAWRFRDWVIAAFNNDLPYDRFIKLQIAADQFSEAPDDLHAMGFLTLGRRFINNKNDIIDDRIDVMSRGLMGLTVTCARCHDHKFDPIPTADYYSLYGVFDSCDEPKNEPSTLRLVDKERPSEPRVFLRGNARNGGPRVPRQFLEVVAREDRKPFTQGSGRKELAEAVANGDNPLTARVWANRVWGHLIGRELVRTPSDFGVRSDPPTHPELLDSLAGRLIDSGWSTKTLIREIVLSNTYRQSSRMTPDDEARDPENLLLAHMNRKRADFESLRDSLLAAAGNLDLTLGGKSVEISGSSTANRRTVYAFIDRQNLPEVFRVFDLASPDTHAPRRYETSVPQQALYLMNSPFALAQAQKLSARFEALEPADRVRELFRAVYARDPSSDEAAAAKDFIDAAPEPESADIASGWEYGYGAVDPDAGKLTSFTPLPHFTGSAWQGGPQLPDDGLGWAMLNSAGGHVGNDLQHAVVRRWSVPADGRLAIRGELRHNTDQGDGVRGRILISGDGQRGVWEVQNRRQRTILSGFDVRAGDTIEFVTDLKGNLNHDSFEWKVRLTLDVAGVGIVESSSDRKFAGPTPLPLKPWDQLAQTLLLSNEFQFID